MGWNYPEISLEEMVKLVKGFVDILILASGYQSSGLLAHWDARNIIKAFQWGLFFENVSIFSSFPLMLEKKFMRILDFAYFQTQFPNKSLYVMTSKG